MRETVESIVIAFVLAFLFRTFEAEAFVIPTGSMAPTLMGRHKDVECPQCSYRYQVSASEEDSRDPRIAGVDLVAGMCPICRYVMPMRPDLRANVREAHEGEVPRQPSYNGDRILVNKYVYTYSDPRRWDVVVFKFPGNAQENYIKRLVGLPGETLRVYQGDIFARDGESGPGESEPGEFEILRKPAKTILAMRQLVHDTQHDSAALFEAGWPLRWIPSPEGSGREWQAETAVDDTTVQQTYSVDAADSEAWLRYVHVVPEYGDWRRLAELQAQAPPGASPKFSAARLREIRPQLIMDANPYNARLGRSVAENRGSLEIDPQKLGLHWVGDLIAEADVTIETDSGELIVDLVEAGQHFRCTIDIASGQATLSAVGIADYQPTAATSVRGPGKYRVALANVDDQLLLWIDGDLVEFAGGTAYDAEQVFGGRRQVRPRTSPEDPGDLAPVGIAARNAKLSVTRLRVWRDTYYIADSWKRNQGGDLVTDFDQGRLDPQLFQLRYEPALWHRFDERNNADFPLGTNQYFVMGDNSAESSDARLWMNGDPRSGGRPGGAYLERSMLIGKALCVYWPHSWNRIPGTPIPFPLFPNFADMRLVR